MISEQSNDSDQIRNVEADFGIAEQLEKVGNKTTCKGL